MGEFSGAAQISHEALEMPRRVLSTEHPNTLASASMFVSVPQEIGELSRISRKALEMPRRVFGAGHPHASASGNDLASES